MSAPSEPRDDRQRSELDQLVEGFEAAWQQGPPPAIDDFLPMGEAPRRAVLVELVYLDLERRLALGEAALVEQYLAKFPELAEDRAFVIDLIASEYRLRKRRDPGLTLATFVERFPQYRDELPRHQAGPLRPRRRFPIHLNCPHCHSPIEIVTNSSDEEILCPSCGSSFRIDPDHTQTWSKDKLPQLGKFELIEAVGRGAFGTVYRARDVQLQRIVAVKVPRSGRLATDEDEDRFVREARNAAQLQHAGIVPVYEVGRSDTFPYIVSEFVEGITLADALTARRFGARESARLAAQVAAALQHAHDQGVVHRDMKPSNIMLTADGSPRVMDFGLAKRDAGEVTMTIEGQVLGTPAYMSPEQASGLAHHVDGRSDIYGLGGILYELLTGELPFRGNQRMILHQVLHDEPRSPRSLNDRIPRDLETICLKAMAKEPARRYQTCQAMADDLMLYLTGQPITARPVGRVERSWRWCRRNPLVAGLSTGVVVALVLGTIVSGYFAIQADARATEAIAEKSRANEKATEALAEKTRADAKAAEAEREREKALASQALEARQRQRAQEAEAQALEDARRAGREALKAQQVAKFLATMFEESAPFETAGIRFGVTEKALANAALTAREILDRGAQRVTVALQDQPEVQAALKETMGNVYLGLGMIDKADVLLQEALELRDQRLPREHLDIASSLHSMAVLRFSQQRFAESADLLEEALAIRRKLLGSDDLLVDNSRVALAALLGLVYPREHSRDVPEAVRLWRESLAWRRGHFGDKHRETAFTMLGLAGGLFENSANSDSQTAENFEGARLVLEATPILLNDPTTRSMGLTIVHFETAELMTRLGQRAAVVAAARSALAAARDAVDDGHPLMQIVKVASAHYFVFGQKFDEAEKIYQECLAILRRRNAPLPLRLLMITREIADPLERRDPPHAEALYRQAIDMTRQALTRQRERKGRASMEATAFVYAVLSFGPMLISSGKTEEADALYREIQPLLPESTEQSLAVRLKHQLADLRFRQESFDEAVGLYRECMESPDKLTGFRRNWIGGVMVSLADCLAAQGKKQEAEELYRRAIMPGEEVYTPGAKIALAKLLSDAGQPEEATALLRTVLDSPLGDESYFKFWTSAWRALYNHNQRRASDPSAHAALIEEARAKLAQARKRFGDQHEQVADILVDIGSALSDHGDFAGAERLLKEALEMRQKVLPGNDFEQGNARLALGACLVGMARYDEAEPLLLWGYSILKPARGPKHEETVKAVKQLVVLYDAWQKPQKADEYRKLLPVDDKATGAAAQSR